MNMPEQWAEYIQGSSAVQIAESVEASVRAGRLLPGAPLPTVRACAEQLQVSPATVASAWRTLRDRGVIVTRGRRGSVIAERTPVAPVAPRALPEGVLDLATGNPDPALLPSLQGALRRVRPEQRLYGEAVQHEALVSLARAQLRRDGVRARALTVVSGALDGIERVLQAHLRPGDRVVVEDPAFAGVLDLLRTLRLQPVGVPIDDAGLLPDALEAALQESRPQALILTPRAQNPTGAALDAGRALRLRPLLRAHTDLLLIEDDHAGPVAGAPLHTLGRVTERWAFVRSYAKSLGPDLRVAILTGDPATVASVEARQLTGMRWVSHLLQRTVVALASERGTETLLERAATTYASRREALLQGLTERCIPAHGRSGLNVWIPVPSEASVAADLEKSGFAVSTGERFRLHTGPALRVTTARLHTRDAPRLADALATALSPPQGRTLST